MIRKVVEQLKIGYPCINLSLECRPSRTFRLASYSEQHLKETIINNLNCLEKILQFNITNNILFFRITSNLIPFASHPICKFEWQRNFADRFSIIGEIIRKEGMRISMHPDQFILINSNSEEIFEKSHRELIYHSQILELLGLDHSAKIQLHVGGTYGNKLESMKRFIKRFDQLDEMIKKRLVIENDDKSYSLNDCLTINAQIGIPVLFDAFHHSLNNYGEKIRECIKLISETWKDRDGIPMVDYSSQQKNGRKGAHANTLNMGHFKKFLDETEGFDLDIMLEIKNKEKSALKAIKAVIKK